MSLGEIVRLWGTVSHQADLRFFDRMYQAAYEIKPKFAHWWTDRIQIVLHDYDSHELIAFSSKHIGFEVANPDDIISTTNKLSGTLNTVAQRLHCNTVNRIGLKLVVFADIGLSFKELIEQIQHHFNLVPDNLKKLTSPDIVDMAISYDYVWQDSTAMLRCGPMNKDQGRQTISSLGCISRLYSPPKEDNEIQKVYDSIPESFLFLDIDIFREGDYRIDAWSTFATLALSHAIDVFNGVKAIILEHNNG